MTYPFRFLGGVNSSSSSPVASSSNETSSATPANVDSDFVVILAALLCALICVLGLVAVARCAWLRRFSLSGSSSSQAQQQQQQRNRQANKGLKEKVLRSLPKHTYSAQVSARFSAECAICLTEFVEGDELRVLPQCGHGFHVSCIDTWLGSHSSCPSCRQILVVTRCQNCGGLPSSSSCEEEARRKEREDRVNRFLP